MSYCEKDDLVVLTMTRSDYAMVLVALGMGLSTARFGGIDRWINVANRINEGNPNFTPYKRPGAIGRDGKETQ